MEKIQEEAAQLVSIGKEYIIRGQYNRAHDSYQKALKYDADHYVIRNALGEIYFIQKKFLTAADNFWLAAFDQSDRVNLDLIKNTKIKDPTLLKKKEQSISKARKIILDYTNKSGLALFAHQYEDPLKKNTQQALINQYRHQIDPCGYRGYVEADPKVLARVEKNVQMIGYRFLNKMNRDKLEHLAKDSALENLLAIFKTNF